MYWIEQELFSSYKFAGPDHCATPALPDKIIQLELADYQLDTFVYNFGLNIL